MSQRPAAVVFGGHDLVRPLGLAGIRSIVAAPKRAVIRHSRFVSDALEWDHEQPLRGQEEALFALLGGLDPPPVLFCEYDGDLLFVSRNRDRLASVSRFLLADAELIEDLVDKLRFQALAERLGLPVPPTVVLTADDEYRLPSDAPVPGVLKPGTRSIEAAWRDVDDRGKAVPVRSAEDLDRLRPRLARYGRPVLLQQSVAGPESAIESYHAYVDPSGTVAGEFTGRKIRTLPREYGLTTSLEITAVADVRGVGREVVERIGLHGVSKLDFKRGPDGRLWLLEINPRHSLWHHPGALAGVNMPALLYADLVGLPRPEVRLRPGVRWFHKTDLAAARQEGVPIWRWAAWALGSRARSGLAIDDPMPALRALARRGG